MIKPEIGKLSKSLVEQIPLVMYIPPPPPGSPHEKVLPTAPDRAHLYPPKPASHPKPSATPPTSQRPRFRFMRRLSSFGGRKRKAATDSQGQPNDDSALREPQSWEENWEQGEYPFVVLEGNRAACAICLMDFEEPKKIGGETPNSPNLPAEATIGQDLTEKSTSSDIAGTADALQAIVEEGRDDGLKLENAGEGAQPLRLLACGHVFHVSLIALP
jgi:hypothetical protein